MRRVLFVMLIVAFVVAGCGGPPADTTVADPPESTIFEGGENAKVDQLVEGWQSTVPTALAEQQIRPETIEQKVYESSASLEEIASFYNTLTEKGWTTAPRMPGLQDGAFLSGYEIGGNTTFVVSAVDASQLGGSGVVIYTVKGQK